MTFEPDPNTEPSLSVYTNSSASTPEETRAYVGALLDLLGDQDPMAVLGRGEGELRKRIDPVDLQRLKQREAPDKWSVSHVVQHLADSELVFAFRVRMILTQDRPALAGYDQDALADRLNYDAADPEQAFREFAVLRHGNLRLLQRAVPEDLQRVGVHAERGEESLAHLIKLYAAHDLLHLRQIDRILG